MRNDMLTKVYLEGSMGETFGREWKLSLNSAAEAIRIIDANKPGLVNWMRRHAQTYTHYQVVVEYEDGRSEDLSDDTYLHPRKMKSIRFVPVIQGAGKWGRAIVGAIMIVVGYYTGNPELIKQGAVMLATGVISALTTPTSNVRLSSGHDTKTLVSEAFDGPVNTTEQGVPVPLIYGRLLVGSQVISAGLVVS